jgi:4'-phosphopantetheinyl transferase
MKIDVWRIALDPEQHPPAALEHLLDEREREKAAAFRFAEHRDAYVIAHGALRLILGDVLGEDPARLAYTRAREGKPRLVGRRLRFNLSHTAGVALVAATAGAEVGVDVEAVRDNVDLEGVARRAFHPDEVAELLALEGDARRAAFFRLWARKEAVMKADGRGLSLDPAGFALPLDGVTVADLDAGPAHAAAVAVTGTIDEIRHEEWAGVHAS